ncbi:hypothetical protein KFE94_17230 [bacterium SCSIO 12643]|nr:hypothetical protein KFE94_17230 [bacterium SCSIO 12643]
MISDVEITALFSNPEDTYVIHYAYMVVDDANGSSKKIISVYAKNLNSTDSREFSIDKISANHDIPKEDINDIFDDLEEIVLDDFNSFLKEKSKCHFIYYGEEDGLGLILDELKRIFEARNKLDAKKKFKEIPTAKRKSIPYLFQFNDSDKSLKKFVKKYNENKLPTGFLSCDEEGVSFEKGAYNKVRESVLCKVDFLVTLLNSERNQTSQSSPYLGPLDIETIRPIDILKNLNIKSWILLSGIVAAIFGGGWGLNSWINSGENKDLQKKNEALKAEIEKSKSDHFEQLSKVADSLNTLNSEKIQKIQNKYESKLDSILSDTSKVSK